MPSLLPISEFRDALTIIERASKTDASSRPLTIFAQGKRWSIKTATNLLHLQYDSISGDGDSLYCNVTPGPLLKVLSAVSGDTVALTRDDTFVTCKTDRSTFKVRMDLREPVPEPDLMVHDTGLSVEAEVLLAQLSVAMTGASDDCMWGKRPGEDVVMLRSTSKSLWTLATDGIRCVRSRSQFDPEIEHVDELEAAIPSVACELLVLILASNPKFLVRIKVEGQKLQVTVHGWTLTVALTAVRFPEVGGLFQVKGTRTDRVSAQSLAKIIKQARICSDVESQAITLVFGNGHIHATAQASEIGEAKIDLEMNDDSTSLEPTTVAIAAKPMLEFLGKLPPDESVEVQSSGPEDNLLLYAGNHSMLLCPICTE